MIPINDLKTNLDGILEICMDGIGVTFNSEKSMLLFQVPATSKNNKALGLRFFPQGNSPSSSLLQTNQ